MQPTLPKKGSWMELIGQDGIQLITPTTTPTIVYSTPYFIGSTSSFSSK